MEDYKKIDITNSLMAAAACSIDNHYPEHYYNVFIEKLEACLEEVNEYKTDDDENNVDESIFFLEELKEVIENLRSHTHKKVITDHIASINWDNYRNDEWDEVDKETEFYSLGSVWYNRLEWILEACCNDNIWSEQVEQLHESSEMLILLFDHLEQAYKD